MVALAPLLATSVRSQVTEKVLYSFNGGSDGSYPRAGLIFDKEGNLYGTTQRGGASESCSDGCGTVFELTPSKGGWTETELYSFIADNGADSDGYFPFSDLIFDSTGNLYGTTLAGGVPNDKGWGTVFELTPSNGYWAESILHDFTYTESNTPTGGLIFDKAGNLYGTTWDAGAGQTGYGSVFELTPSKGGWTETVLHNFAGSDGWAPYAGLIFDNAGNLYGTTENGGATMSGGFGGYGAVFELTFSNGAWTETVLHSFTGSDGAYPGSTLIFDKAGNLYSTTYQGGANGYGTVFELTFSNGAWTETVLHSFTGSDGAYPAGAGLIFDSAGNLYGTTSSGGTAGDGVIFELTPSEGGWTETVLHDFAGSDGSYPNGDLTFDSAGNLYGTTFLGGMAGVGVVFEITGLASGGFLNFPLANTDAYSVDISSVFDHDVKADKKTKAPIFYGKNAKVRAYTGEEGVSNCGYPPCSEPVGTQGLVGYKNTDDQPFVITGNGHYTGGSGCVNGPCDLFLFYTGHSGFDYPQTFRTEIIAPADGLLFIPLDDPVIKPDKTPGQSVANFDILAIDHGNGYASWFLHVGCQAGTKDQNGKVVCKKTQDFRGIDANGNVICSHDQLVTTGCPVKSGDVVGLVGNKGLAKLTSVSHLHFEVRKGLTENQNALPTCVIGSCIPVDPYGWTGTGSDPYSQFIGGQPNVRLWK